MSRKPIEVEINKIHKRGIYAGIIGKSLEMCPYSEKNGKRSAWIDGWRIGREQHIITGSEAQQRKSIITLSGVNFDDTGEGSTYH